MKLPFLVLSLVALSGLAYVTMSTPDDAKPRTFSRAGAKVVSVGKREVPKESKSVMETFIGFARSMSGADAGQGGSDLDALHARTEAEKSIMSNITYEGLMTTAEDGVAMADDMGIEVGPSAFDADLQARKDAADPIKRLND